MISLFYEVITIAQRLLLADISDPYYGIFNGCIRVYHYFATAHQKMSFGGSWLLLSLALCHVFVFTLCHLLWLTYRLDLLHLVSWWVFVLRQAKTRQDKPRQDKTRQDSSRYSSFSLTFIIISFILTRQDKTRQARQDTTRHDTTRQEQIRQDKTR